MSVVVVGVDGSAGADEALRFAATEASLRGAKLRVVCAWEVPAAVYAGAWGLGADQEAGFGDAAQEVADSARGLAARLEPKLEVESHVARGQPADVLVNESQDADLLVVGSRGLGGFKRLLLGSVSQQVAHHAACPVVIVPPAAPGPAES
jgi:nucleotide-binding universal stress UspA family protein